jgi:hypothetical protein
MPVAFVTTAPLTDWRRAKFAADLTEGLASAASVGAEKVQVFFTERTPGAETVVVHAVGSTDDRPAWLAAIWEAIGHTYETSINFYPPERTAKGGKLRTAPAGADTRTDDNPERQEQ